MSGWYPKRVRTITQSCLKHDTIMSETWQNNACNATKSCLKHDQIMSEKWTYSWIHAKMQDACMESRSVFTNKLQASKINNQQTPNGERRTSPWGGRAVSEFRHSSYVCNSRTDTTMLSKFSKDSAPSIVGCPWGFNSTTWKKKRLDWPLSKLLPVNARGASKLPLLPKAKGSTSVGAWSWNVSTRPVFSRL